MYRVAMSSWSDSLPRYFLSQSTPHESGAGVTLVVS